MSHTHTDTHRSEKSFSQQLGALFFFFLSTCYADCPLVLIASFSLWPLRVWELARLNPALSLVRFPARAASRTCFMFSRTSALACFSRSAWPWVSGKMGNTKIRRQGLQRTRVRAGRLKEQSMSNQPEAETCSDTLPRLAVGLFQRA